MNSAGDEIRSRIEGLDLRTIMVETRLTQIHQGKKLDQICGTLKEQEKRIADLEKHDARSEGAKEQGKDATAIMIAVAAILISAASTILNLIGGG